MDNDNVLNKLTEEEALFIMRATQQIYSPENIGEYQESTEEALSLFTELVSVEVA